MGLSWHTLLSDTTGRFLVRIEGSELKQGWCLLLFLNEVVGSRIGAAR